MAVVGRLVGVAHEFLEPTEFVTGVMDGGTLKPDRGPTRIVR